LNFLVTPGARGITRGFNLLTSQQVWARDMLAAHSGKTVCLSVFEQKLNFSIDSQGKLAVADLSIVPDVTVSFIAERFDLAKLMATWPKLDMIDYVNVAGEASLAQVLSVIAKDLKPEPEDALAEHIGDIGARRASQVVVAVGGWVKDSAVRATQNVSEYLSFEAGVLLDQQSLKLFETDLITTASDLDSLSRRLQNLSQRTDNLSKLDQGERS
jgi:ubiquinone biosynthesis protein UbiJ